MIPIVGVSLEEALLGFGGDDAELHDKEVELSTSDITGSQTAVFEYNPQNETPTPWDGYSLFTIDLSGVKDDIEDLQQQISDAEACRQQVIAVLQQYDPDYDPDEGECPADKVTEVVEHAEECDDCKAEVVAKLQEYDPDFDPVTCQDIVNKVDEIEEEAEKPPQYTFEQDPDDPTYPDPDFYDNITKVVGKQDPVTDNDLHIVIRAVDDREPPIPAGQHNVYYGFFDSVTGALIDRTQAFQSTIDPEHTDYVSNFRITDPSTGAYTFDWVVYGYEFPYGYIWKHYTYTGTSQNLIGYGDPTHSYTVSKNN